MASDVLDELTAPMPAPPVRQFSFTDFQVNNPTAPPPGDRLDAEFDRANNAIADTITWASVSLNTDGSIRDGLVGENNLVSGLFDDVAQGVIDDVQPLVDQALAASGAALASANGAATSASNSASSATLASNEAALAQGFATTAQTASTNAQGYASTAGNAAGAASNDANDAQQYSVECYNYTSLAGAWAEHMPDTIPPNILAVMGVTGDHWSSRWWANQAAIVTTGANNYRGVWNPNTNVPTLASGGLVNGLPGENGDYYLVSVSGTSVPIDGQTAWIGGDLIINNGHAWQRVQIAYPGGPFLPISGGSMTGALTLAGAPVQGLQAATKTYVDGFLPLSGGSMTGALMLSADPASALQAATKTYVDGFLPLSGGSMTGALMLSADPTSALHAATKQYVDRSVADTVVNVLDHGAKGDGSTNDTAAIQMVLNAYAGKATVFVPNTGSAFRTSRLTVPTGTELLLLGTLQALPGLTGSYIDTAGANNIMIRGSGVIDGYRVGQTNVGGMAGLAISNSVNVRVSGVTLQNAYHWNLNVTVSRNVVVNGVSMIGGGAANEFAAGSIDCWLTNCMIDGTGLGDYAFCFYGGVLSSGAIGNTVKNAGAGMGPTSNAPGIGVLSDTPQPAPCHDITIANNIIHGCGGPGLVVLGKDTSNITTGVTLANNRSFNNDKNGVGFVAGADVFIDYAKNITVTGNQISDNGNPAGPYYTGIFLGPNTSQLNITDNQIYNIGSGFGPAPGSVKNAGIYASNPTYAFISGNHFYDNQPTPSMAFSVIGGVQAGSSILNNHFGCAFNAGFSTDVVLANASGGNVFGLGKFTTLRTVAPQQFLDVTGSAPRWYIGVTGETESGSNAGSNYQISSVADDNTTQVSVLKLNRASGVVTLSGGLDTLHVSHSTASYVVQGAYIMWSRSGGGLTNFVNNRGLGSGGFNFFDSDGTTDTPLLTLASAGATFNVRMVFSPLPVNAINDAAAASAGVPVGGVYRNSNTLMVRVA